MNKKLILIGPPGAGKGTIADLLIEKFNFTHISTGNSLRIVAEEQSELGIKVKTIMNEGGLLPDEIVDEIIKEALSKEDAKDSFILDGYPRHVGQAEKLIDWVKIDEVVVVDMKDEDIIERLNGRRTCPKCGASYHIVNIPPKVEGICDFCGTKLIKRADEDKIKHRLDVYHKETEPVIEFLKNKGIRIQKVPGDFDVKTQKEWMGNLIVYNQE
ncbi:MAG: adenylate kinase family protein [Candidatus Woesearchaeota archaeon]